MSVNVVLDESQIAPLVRQIVAACVSQLMRVHLRRQPCSFARLGNLRSALQIDVGDAKPVTSDARRPCRQAIRIIAWLRVPWRPFFAARSDDAPSSASSRNLTPKVLRVGYGKPPVAGRL